VASAFEEEFAFCLIPERERMGELTPNHVGRCSPATNRQSVREKYVSGGKVSVGTHIASQQGGERERDRETDRPIPRITLNSRSAPFYQICSSKAKDAYIHTYIHTDRQTDIAFGHLHCHSLGWLTM
jgi:hypothetical protein